MEESASVSGTTARTLSDALAALKTQTRPEDYIEVPIDASRVQIVKSPSRLAKEWPISIETPAGPWSYAAYLPIPQNARRVSHAYLRIRTTAVRGQPWVGVLTRDQKAFLCRSVLPEGSEAHETLFGSLNLRSASTIVVENGAEFGSSIVTIEIASLLVPVSSEDIAFDVVADSSSAPMKSDAMPSKVVRLGRHRFILHGLSEDDAYFQSIGNNYEPEFQAFCHQFIDEDAICIDIGANIGVKALLLSRHARKGRVIAVEAAPSIARCLEINITANAASNVECVQAAVGDRIDTVHFFEMSAYGHVASEGIEVPMITLQEIVRNRSLPRIDFIKIDVEGFEYAILKNAYDVINDFRALVLFEFNSWCQLAFADVNPKEFLEWIFEHFAYVGILRTPTSGDDLVEQVRGEDLLYVLHDNLVSRGCVTELVVTNAVERL